MNVPMSKKEIANANKQKILEYYLNECEKTGKAPTVVSIAENTGLSRVTVHNHLNNLVLPDITDHHKKSAPEIITGMIKKAKLGDVQAAKLYFQLVYGWNEKKIIESNVTNKTLQVNISGDSDKVKEIIKKLDNNTEETEFEELDSED